MRKIIENRIEKILGMISQYNALNLETEELWIKHGQFDTSRIRHFDSYPYDYQCFMKKVGWLRYSPGHAGLTVFSSPVVLKDFPDDEPEGGDELEWIRAFYGDDQKVSERAKADNISDHILVAEDVCGFSCIAFNPRTTPYATIDIQDPNNSYFDSFLKYVENSLERPNDEVRAHGGGSAF